MNDECYTDLYNHHRSRLLIAYTRSYCIANLTDLHVKYLPAYPSYLPSISLYSKANSKIILTMEPNFLSLFYLASLSRPLFSISHYSCITHFERTNGDRGRTLLRIDISIPESIFYSYNYRIPDFSVLQYAAQRNILDFYKHALGCSTTTKS